MKKVICFFAEAYYGLLLNKTIAFIVLLLLEFFFWTDGNEEDDLFSLFGKIGMIMTAAFMLFCWIHGWILYALDREKWTELRAEANGGKPFLRTKQALVLAVFALLLVITTIYTLAVGEQSSFTVQWIVLAALSVIYLVCFILGPNRLPHFSPPEKKQ